MQMIGRYSQRQKISYRGRERKRERGKRRDTETERGGMAGIIRNGLKVSAKKTEVMACTR